VKNFVQSPEIPDETIAITAQLNFVVTASNTSLTSWGAGDYGALGIGTTPKFKYYPVTTNISTILQNRKIASVFSASTLAGLLTDTGEVYMWGYNTYGLGDGTSATIRSVPTKIVDVDGIVFTKVELFTTVCALTDNGQLYMWGQNDYRKFGNSSLTSGTQPRPILFANPTVSNKRFIQASPSTYAMFAITTENVLYAWGVNLNAMFGQGNSNSTVFTNPVMINTGALQSTFVIKVKPHNVGVLVITTDGKVCYIFSY
jgi:hypothetical protein